MFANRLPRLSLAVKIGGTLAVLVAVSLSWHLLINDAWRRVRSQKQAQAKQLAEIVVGIVRSEVMAGAPDQVQEHLDGILRHPDVHNIRIFGRSGILRYALDGKNVGETFDRASNPDCLNCHGAGSEITQSLVRDLDGHRLFSYDVTLRNEGACAQCHGTDASVLGNLLLDIHLTEPDLAALADDRRLAITGVLLVLLTVVGAWFLIRSMVVKPLRSLSLAAQQVEAGNLEPRFPAPRADEIGDLIGAFQRMTGRLKHLIRHQEQVIAERTEELRKSQVQAAHHEKMVALGRLTGGLAHEIGNPLASISAMVQMLARQNPDPAVQDTTNDLLAQVERINRIVRDMLEHYHPGTRKAEWIDVSQPIDAALRIARYDRGLKRVEVKKIISQDCPAVHLVEDELLQVLLNIFLNAADAMPGGGVLHIGAKPSGGGVELTVSDSGGGIAPADLRRIFEPFFTTKPPGKGTGLGLWVSYSIVKRWGGDIEVRSEEGRGTEVRIYIPKGKGVTLNVRADTDHR